MDNTYEIIARIRKTTRFKKYLVFFLIITSACGLLSFLFYSFDSTSNAIKFISKRNDFNKIEKVMVNPKIKFEYDDRQIFNISASKAIHRGEDDVEMFNAEASGNAGSVSAGNLLITNKGNNLHFSNNPILIIKENEQ
jgi:hypothetical protein